MQFPKVLVLGATGRIGTILRKCWPQGPQGPLWQSRTPRPGPGWIVLDPLRDPAALARAASGCQAILCLAGVVPGRGQTADPRDNIALAEAALRAGAAAGQGGAPSRVFLASSAAVYGAAPGLLHEDMALAPVSDYGRAKAAMEARAAALGRELGVPVTSLRIGNVAGVDAILGGWAPGFQLDRFADGTTPRRSYIGAITLARVLGELLAAADLPDVLNIAAPGAIRMGALLQAADLDWTPRPAPDTAIPDVRLCTDRLQRFTRFAPADSTAAAMVAEWRRLTSDPDGTDRGRAETE
ncbi:NAD-dependent epimerase/dehydratase family protein [Sedimentitalea sp. HM32M-2]|uniref:NAD-dependent epimerase/dehydratase family protein n=1 Tax=Sedimentitalea sp. HM32M-2 TaxID=3351566 RepID=UPI00364239D0